MSNKIWQTHCVKTHKLISPPFNSDYFGYNVENNQIQLEHTVTQQEVKKMIYSSQDKFNSLADKNPALHELRKALNLEVDY